MKFYRTRLVDAEVSVNNATVPLQSACVCCCDFIGVFPLHPLNGCETHRCKYCTSVPFMSSSCFIDVGAEVAFHVINFM